MYRTEATVLVVISGSGKRQRQEPSDSYYSSNSSNGYSSWTIVTHRQYRPRSTVQLTEEAASISISSWYPVDTTTTTTTWHAPGTDPGPFLNRFSFFLFYFYYLFGWNCHTVTHTNVYSSVWCRAKIFDLDQAAFNASFCHHSSFMYESFPIQTTLWHLRTI